MKRFFWLIFILLAACTLPASQTPTPVPAADTVATAVAQKLTAVAESTLAVPLAGTEVHALPSAPVPSSTPKPDKANLRVVYVRDGNLWLWEEAQPRQLTNSGQAARPRLSDDGQVVAFSQDGELWAVNTDGSGARVLASSADLATLPHDGQGRQMVSNFEFAPASHIVYFNTTNTGENFSTQQFDLASINADAPVVQALLKNGAGGEITFAPDGRQIALVQPDKINLVNADGSDFKTLFTFKLVSTYSEWFYIPTVLWMPDSSGFQTVIPASDPLGNPKELTRFYFISTTGRKPAKLAEFLALPIFQSGAYISPDGVKVVYVKPQGNRWELHVIDASTADKLLLNLPREKSRLLGFAPDSQQVLYWDNDANQARIVTLDGQATPLVDETHAYYVTWVDDRRYICVNESELCLCSLGQPSQLIDAHASNEFDYTLLP